MIKYYITPDVARHIYKVKLEFIASSFFSSLMLPTWIPGSYMIREFSKSIINVDILNAGAKLHQVSKNEWQIEGINAGEIVEIEYQVYAYEYGIRTAFLDSTRGYFNPSSICLSVVGMQEVQHIVEFSDLPDNWKVISGLSEFSAVKFFAKDYDELLDNPFELGDYQEYAFDVDGVKHSLILSGVIVDFDKERMLADMKKVCAYQIKMFGSTAPYPYYHFILNLSGNVFTGLEHRNSTLLMAPYSALPSLSNHNNDEYIKLMGLISHEFFHTWNVKRLKPQKFMPYDLTNENYTKLLWWFEGVTSYYDDLVLYRTKVISQAQYLQTILDNINNVYKFAGAQTQSLADSSLTTWIKYYRQDENTPNAVVSYYIKGAIVAMCLDLFIRTTSDASLDSVIVALFKRYQEKNVGLAEDEIATFILQTTGVDLAKFITHAVDTTKALPLKELFAKVGLQLHKVAAKDFASMGKYHAELKAVAENKAIDLGAKLEKATFGVVIKNIYAGACLERAGFAANDVLIAIDDNKIVDINKQLGFYKVNDEIEISYFRQDKLLRTKVVLENSICSVYDLMLEDARLLNNKWLG